jgi:alanine dehydrogenase
VLRLLDGDDVRACAPTAAVVEAVADAFAATDRGDVVMPPKSYVDLPRYDGDFRAMPAYVDGGTWDAAGLKWVNSHPHNPDRFDLPTVMGVMIYSDPETARPLAVLDGATLTRLRTGAAAAVATDHLAVSGASSLGLVGAGAQSYAQLDAIATVRHIRRVVVADVDEEAARAFVEAVGDRFDARVGTVAEAAACDVLSTTTPVEEPVVPRSAVGERTHVNAMGADAAGKHELADAVLADAMIVIDDWDQCVHSGEINVPWAAGLLDEDDIHAELGAVVAGSASGRTAETGITVFDSTGLAVQDVAAAHAVYERAVTDDVGAEFDLLGV